MNKSHESRARSPFLGVDARIWASTPRNRDHGPRWVQLGLSVTADGRPVMYAELAATARSLLAEPNVDNFFFMHKPPGLRIRFETTPADRDELASRLLALAEEWQTKGLIVDVLSGIYEPEEHLFGGSVSMRYVHELFTIDSMAWLERHAAPIDDLPAWAYSLRVLRALQDGLGVVGWEDLDVWDRIRRKAGRRLPASVLESDRFAATARGIRAAWADARTASDDDTASSAVRAVAQRWRAGYFDTRHARIGPREAAAIATIFHWNRAGLTGLRQSLLTEALADRSAL